MDVLDSELTKIPWKHFFYLGKQRRRRRLSNKKALYWNDDVALMRLRGSHFALLQFCIRTQLIHFQDSQQLPSQPASSIHEKELFMVLLHSWMGQSRYMGLLAHIIHYLVSVPYLLSLYVCLFFLFYRIMIIPPVVSFGTLISLSSNFSQKSYNPSCINTDYISCPIHLNVWV